MRPVRRTILLLACCVASWTASSCLPAGEHGSALGDEHADPAPDGGAPADAPTDDDPPDDDDDAGPRTDDEPPDAGAPEQGVTCTGDHTVSGCAPDSEGDLRCSLAHGGRTREYLLHVPPMLEGPMPVVFAFHGLRTTAGLQRWISNMNDAADAHGYVVVYPEGIGTSALDQSFNAGLCCGVAQASAVDDVGFTLAILEVLRAPLCVDARRVFATGLSNGGHMAYRLACERADVFAAIAPVAGLVTVASCTPARPVAVLHFHGTEDRIVGYSTGIDGITGAVDTVERWAERDGCASTPELVHEQGEASCVAYPDCQGAASVELCTIEGGGHTWPGGEELTVLGHTTQDLDATERISQFFEAHPMP